jgi:hypothetical protein
MISKLHKLTSMTTMDRIASHSANILHLLDLYKDSFIVEKNYCKCPSDLENYSSNLTFSWNINQDKKTYSESYSNPHIS